MPVTHKTIMRFDLDAALGGFVMAAYKKKVL